MINIKEQKDKNTENIKVNNWDCIEEETNNRVKKDDRDEEWD